VLDLQRCFIVYQRSISPNTSDGEGDTIAVGVVCLPPKQNNGSDDEGIIHTRGAQDAELSVVATPDTALGVPHPAVRQLVLRGATAFRVELGSGGRSCALDGAGVPRHRSQHAVRERAYLGRAERAVPCIQRSIGLLTAPS